MWGFKQRRKELEVKIVPCFYDTKRAELLVVRYGWFGNLKCLKSFGFVYLSDKKSEERIDWVIELVEKFNRIQNMRHERKKRTMYDARYALTNGTINKVIVDGNEFKNKDLVIVKGECFFSRVGSDVFFTEEEARKSANERVRKRILSLEKQIEKLKTLKF